MNASSLTDIAGQWMLLTDPSDARGAGRDRYAAAMHLYQSGELTAEDVEAYRALAKQDGRLHPGRAAHLIRSLIAAIEHHLDRAAPERFAEVRRGIAQWKAGDVVLPEPRLLPACRHLDNALPLLAEPLRSAIHRAAPVLRWITYDAYPLADIGTAFAQGHAFASIIGEAAPVNGRDFDLGLFIIAPGTLYRDHRHKAPELYVPLTGPHGWRFAPGDAFVMRPADEPVWNEPLAPHATLTGRTPFVCYFCWTRDVNEPAEVIPAADWRCFEFNRP